VKDDGRGGEARVTLDGVYVSVSVYISDGAEGGLASIFFFLCVDDFFSMLLCTEAMS
jgi:hypothetical protein